MKARKRKKDQYWFGYIPLSVPADSGKVKLPSISGSSTSFLVIEQVSAVSFMFFRVHPLSRSR